MKKSVISGACITSLYIAAIGANAQTTITDCPKGYEPATIELQAIVSTNQTGCPLLEQKELRKLVDKNLSGTVFAYPAVPKTCASGTVSNGNIFSEEGTINVRGTTESAQRFFPEALAVNPSWGGLFLNGLSQDGVPFASGAAATIVSLEGVNSPLDLQLILSDRFTLKLDSFPIIDTEDFEVVGSKGASVTGRLTGIAEIEQYPPEPFVDAEFNVQGHICIK